MILNNKKILIVRGGVSGLSAARMCLAHKACVYIYDKRELKELTDDRYIYQKCNYVDDKQIEKVIQKVDIIVVSPAIRKNDIIVQIASKYGKIIISEIELGINFCKKPIIAITGTNGKTTLTKLCNKMINYYEKQSEAFGNINIGFAENVDRINLYNEFYVVLEISAQHMEFTKGLKPMISVITNIEPEHMDEYERFTEYRENKAKIFKKQEKGDYTIFNYDDKNCRELAKKCDAKCLWFSFNDEIDKDGIYYKDNKIYIVNNKKTSVYMSNVDKYIRIDFIEHCLILILISQVIGIKSIVNFIANINYREFENRLELVKEINNVKYINDSKSTNPYCTMFALKILKNVILILGSNNKKKSDFTYLVEYIVENAKYTILIDETGKIIEKIFQEKKYDKFQYAKNLQEAVQIAKQKAEKWDNVVFSPGGNSYPMFKNHIERGKEFKKIVNGM